MSVRDAPKDQPYFPLTGVANDGWSTDTEATATCFCGAVQLSFPTSGPGLVDVFICNCTDCRKITASMFASNFTIDDKYLKHLRGQDNLKQYGQKHSIGSGETMTNYFCQTCGTLMYRVGAKFPGFSILRLGTVDDFTLAETKLKPQQEQFVKDRAGWLDGVKIKGIKRNEGISVAYGGKEELETIV
ncbi:Mss4-like protein [Paraphoma chrysanthemicola]|uniref:Mss4-like protein n=1 Tax=Paraphoma chrysanthemicola TaxID=798071 RepID=A0A8K0R5Y4_9PLEO|nr:Mss4-like protein [Paraphoma chrysanthemicola]